VLYFKEAKAEMTSTLGPVPSYTREPKDDKFIACALANGAEVVITVNEDILTLGSLMNVQIVAPQDFVTLLKHRIGGIS